MDMRRIAGLVAIVMLVGGLAGARAGDARGAALPLPAPAPRAKAACARPRLLILSAFPAEMGKMMRSTKLDSVEPVRSPAPKSKEFWTGTLRGKAVIEALTGIGPVNATDTTSAAFNLFPCISGVVFSGVAGGGSDHNGPHAAARKSRIGDVTVPDSWDGGKDWSGTADRKMVATAARVAGSVHLQSKPPLGDYTCACVDWGTIPTVEFPYTPQVFVGGLGSTTDPFGGKAAPCLQHGGDLGGCEPCPAALGTSPDPARFVTGMADFADPAVVFGLFSLGSGGGSGKQFIEGDEETGAVAAVANAKGIPFIGFRGISDGDPFSDPLLLPGFPVTFFVYTQIAADNSAEMVFAFLDAWS